MTRHNMKVLTGKTNAKFAFVQIVVASLRNTPPPDFSEQSIFENLAGSPEQTILFSWDTRKIPKVMGREDELKDGVMPTR